MSRAESPLNRKQGVLLCAALAGLAGWTETHAQESLEAARATRAYAKNRTARYSQGDYNLKAGPIEFSTGATLGVEYNDNINTSPTDPESDVIITPFATLSAVWPITEYNRLSLDTGVGYSLYLENSENNRLQVSPRTSSDISFDFLVSIFRFNVHDRFSYSQDPIRNGSVANTAEFGQFQNTAGLLTSWELKDWQFSVGYDHTLYVYNDSFSNSDRTLHSIFARAGYTFSPALVVGLSSSVGFTKYDEGYRNDSRNYTVGPFIEWMISRYTSLSVSAGFSKYEIVAAGAIGDTEAPVSFYADVEFENSFNEYISQSLALSRRTTESVGIGSSFLESYIARHNITWDVIKDVRLSTNLFYEDSKDVGGPRAEKFQRIGAGISAGYQLTQHLSTGLGYDYITKDSNIPTQEYDQNRVTLTANYAF
ncbi:MAG: outer membrane beta-barrel protein [Verrucomicrobiota bacterium]|nr:outer membrane beta-barrel protein [Verrucomicrobiota bacterium]